METRTVFILGFIIVQSIHKSVNSTDPERITKPKEFNEIESWNFKYNQHNGNHLIGDDAGNNTLSRVKRQYYYGRDRYYPIPIFVGGVAYPAFGPRGYGYSGFGGRGFEGRGFGGRAFGGRGFGGRGIGGRGIGGRGIGGRGIGGRGGIGGGRGGRG